MMDTRIAGIPCKIRIDAYEKFRPGFYTGPWGDCFPEEGELVFTVCDRKGRPAPWLERKMTREDEDRIVSEILYEKEGQYVVFD